MTVSVCLFSHAEQRMSCGDGKDVEKAMFGNVAYKHSSIHLSEFVHDSLSVDCLKS